ncbi:hypothetical protein NMY22_g18882 [Coprinellus aureogranulatus]|nr:hypothetical protein NMY22_g18882 [Coprinellus aureogranulatus]
MLGPTSAPSAPTRAPTCPMIRTQASNGNPPPGSGSSDLWGGINQDFDPSAFPFDNEAFFEGPQNNIGGDQIGDFGEESAGGQNPTVYVGANAVAPPSALGLNTQDWNQLQMTRNHPLQLTPDPATLNALGMQLALESTGSRENRAEVDSQDEANGLSFSEPSNESQGNLFGDSSSVSRNSRSSFGNSLATSGTPSVRWNDGGQDGGAMGKLMERVGERKDGTDGGRPQTKLRTIPAVSDNANTTPGIGRDTVDSGDKSGGNGKVHPSGWDLGRA